MENKTDFDRVPDCARSMTITPDRKVILTWGENNDVIMVDDPNGKFIVGIDPFRLKLDSAIFATKPEGHCVHLTPYTPPKLSWRIWLKYRLLKRRIELFLKELLNG